MKFLRHIWKKLLCISIILFSIIAIFNEKSATKMIIEKSDEKIQACQREIESLQTQLTVISKYRKKLDEKFIEQKTELTSEIQELKQTIKLLKDENFQLKDKCSKTTNNNGDNNENDNSNGDKKYVIERIPVNEENNNNITGEISLLKDINFQQEKEIQELKNQLNQQITKYETLMKHSIDQRRPENETNNEIDPLLHPDSEHKGYADGENVHFHRKIPSSADLEFKRDKDKFSLPQILAPKELVKKLQEKHREKENDKVKNDGREEVVDYQSLKKPEKEENDYKEMGD
jgi:hypothetical protein